MTSRALNASGAFNVGILPGISHPYLLHAQMALRAMGARPMLFSHFVFNK